VIELPLAGEELATGMNSTSGRAISGSDLGAQTSFSGLIYALATSERPARECDLSVIPTDWDGKTSGRSSSVSGRSGTRPGPDWEVGRLERTGEPAGSIFSAVLMNSIRVR